MINQAVRIQTLHRAEYDAAAAEFPLVPFQESAWVEALARPGRQPAYFGFHRGLRRVGVVAGLVTASPQRILAGISRRLYLYGLPHFPPEDAPAVMEQLRAHLRERGFNTIDVAYYYNAPPPQVAALGLSTKLAEEYRLDLSPSLAEIERGLNRLRRRLIRRAKENRLVYEESPAAEGLDALLACLNQTKRRRAERGVGSYSYYYIPGLDDTAVRRLLESGLARLCKVLREGRLISAGLVARNRRCAYYILAGATEDGYDLGASTYMQWCVIERTKAAGCVTLNLGGVPKDESSGQLVEFKRSFGAQAHVCESGSCCLVSPWRRSLHRLYKFAAQPRSYLQAGARGLARRSLPGFTPSSRASDDAGEINNQ